MAAGLGYKEFTTGDVLTAADANGYLASQVVMVFASSAARASAITSPQEGMITYLKDTNSTEYYSGSAYVAIGGGGGGKVLQVVNVATTTSTLNSTDTFVDCTNLTATITPALATSKVLVLVSASGLMKTSANADNAVMLRLLRGGTTILNISSSEGYTGTALLNVTSASTSYLDSPATTSATTYKVQIANYINGARASINTQLGATTTNSTITLLEIGA
jgi:hypothetical protein